MALTNKDLFGVTRGRCNEAHCGCQHYKVLSPLKIKCDYCDHCPNVHGKICDLEPVNEPVDLGASCRQPPYPREATVARNELMNIPVNHGVQCTTQVSSAHDGRPGRSTQEQNELALPVVSLPGCSRDSLSSIDYEGSPHDHAEACGGTRESEDVHNHGPQQARPPVVAAGNKSQLPRQPTRSKEFSDWLLQSLPLFSECVQPILLGKTVSQKQHKRLCRQRRAEVTLFLDENDIITSTNTAECRWMYNALGEALSKKHPRLLWDGSKPGIRLQRRSHVYSAFIRRLSVARKVRRHRAKKMAEPVPALASTLVITKDNAALELQALGSASLTGVTHNMERIRVLLDLTLPDRRNVHMDPLPQYFLVEEILCMEVKVRFQSQIVVLEKRLADAARVFSKSQENESTLLDIMNYLQLNIGHKLINEAPLLEGELQVTAPHIYTNSEGTGIFAGSEAEVVRLSTGSLERRNSVPSHVLHQEPGIPVCVFANALARSKADYAGRTCAQGGHGKAFKVPIGTVEKGRFWRKGRLNDIVGFPPKLFANYHTREFFFCEA
ncbi:unnamed protein product [Ixodes pacificus]